MSSATTTNRSQSQPASDSGFVAFLKKLHSIEFGKKREEDPTKIRSAKLADLLRLLLMLLENGLSLPKFLESLAAERSKKNSDLALSTEADDSSRGTNRQQGTFCTCFDLQLTCFCVANIDLILVEDGCRQYARETAC